MDEIYCKYLKIEDVTPWHGDVFDHPTYKYYCTKKSKEVLYLMCIRCKDNTLKSGDNK